MFQIILKGAHDGPGELCSKCYQASAVSGRSANRAAEPLRRLIVRYPGVKAICFDVMIPDARGRKGQTDTATSYAARGTLSFGLF